jgi:hypothetical protein
MQVIILINNLAKLDARAQWHRHEQEHNNNYESNGNHVKQPKGEQ